MIWTYQHGLPNESFKGRVKIIQARQQRICDQKSKRNLIISHYTRWNTKSSNTKSLENRKRVADSVRSKSPNCKLAILNIITGNNKNKIDKNVETFNIRLSKFCNKNRRDIIDNKNLDANFLN